MVICLERGADLHTAQLMPLPLTVSCSSKIQIVFTFLVPAYPGSPGERAVKRVCVWFVFSASRCAGERTVGVVGGDSPGVASVEQLSSRASLAASNSSRCVARSTSSTYSRHLLSWRASALRSNTSVTYNQPPTPQASALNQGPRQGRISSSSSS